MNDLESVIQDIMETYKKCEVYIGDLKLYDYKINFSRGTAYIKITSENKIAITGRRKRLTGAVDNIFYISIKYSDYSCFLNWLRLLHV